MTQIASEVLQGIVHRIDNLEEEINGLNSDKSEVYKEAKGKGFDVKVLRKVIQDRRKDPADRAEFDDTYAAYMHALEGVENTKESKPYKERAPVHARSDTPHDPDTGEITEIQSADRSSADVAPDAADSGPVTPQDDAKVRDSVSNEIPSAAPYGGERGASTSGTQSRDEAQPQTEGATPKVVVADLSDRANSGNSPQRSNVECIVRDTRTPNDILGDEPIPAYLDRRSPQNAA